MSFLSSHRAIDTMARWRPLWANFVRDNDLEPSQFAGYVQQCDRPCLLVPEDFDAKYEGFCQLCGFNCYPYTPDQCLHLKSDKHAKNVRISDLIPWCNPPGAVQRNLVGKPDQTTETPEAPEGRRSRVCDYRVQSSHGADVPDSGNAPLAPMTPADELLDKIKQLEGEVESLKKAKVDLEGEIESLRKDKDEMKDPLGVLKAKVDDNLSYYDTEFKILYGKVAALERAPAHE